MANWQSWAGELDSSAFHWCLQIHHLYKVGRGGESNLQDSRDVGLAVGTGRKGVVDMLSLNTLT